MPVISAIITTYNRASYLEHAISSVLAQQYQDYELLILDNSSNDNTEEVVKKFTDPRIRYIKHPPLNISKTRNLGVKEARGEYIAFLDDDDEWLANKLGDELAVFQRSSDRVAMVYGGFIRYDQFGKDFYTHVPRLKGFVLKHLLTLKDAFTGSASNPLIKKSVIHQLNGFDEEVKTGEDWEFYLRLARNYEVAYVKQPVVKVRHHLGARLGDRLEDYVDLETKVMQHFSDIFQEEKNLKSFYFQRIGGKLLRLGRKKEGLKFLFKSIRLNKINIYAYIQIFLSLLGSKVYLFFHRLYLNMRRPFKV